MTLEKFTFLKNKAYSGSGLMMSDETNRVVNNLNSIKRTTSNNDIFDITSQLNVIKTGILYKLSLGDDRFMIFKYGSRKIEMKAPTHYDSERNNEYVTFNVIIPDLLICKRNDADMSISILIDGHSYNWPFHNVYRPYQPLYANCPCPQDIDRNNNLIDIRSQRVCEGYSTQGLSFFKTPELYIHSLLTAQSNYDLSTYLDDFDNNKFIKILRSSNQEYIDFSQVSNILKGHFNISQYIDYCHNGQDLNTLISYLEENDHFTDIALRMLMRGHAYQNIQEYFNNRDHRATANMLVFAIVSNLNDKQLVDNLLKNSVIY